MPLDRIENTAGLLHKIKFYILYVKKFFLLIHFSVLEDYELPKRTSHILSIQYSKCGRRQNSSLDLSLF